MGLGGSIRIATGFNLNPEAKKSLKIIWTGSLTLLNFFKTLGFNRKLARLRELAFSVRVFWLTIAFVV